MPLGDVTKTHRYVPQFRLDPKYAPLIRRGTILEKQANRSSFPARRAVGQTLIDLWVDDTLYPMDPATNSTPNFSTAKEYVEFLCHGEPGEGGMLGYTKRLSTPGFDSGGSSGGQTNPHPEECVVRLQAKVLTYEQDI
jgi:hypothetical protein